MSQPNYKNHIKAIHRKYIQVIQETGVSALAVHGRTKDERPNNDVHLEYIQEVSKVSGISVTGIFQTICFLTKCRHNDN